jgi:hypothetical protein
MYKREQLDHLGRRERQLGVLAAVFVFILAGGLASFMYPLVFLHPEGNKWTLRVAFFGFCVLVLLFELYLFDHHRTVGRLKQQLLEELERNVALRHQAKVDLLESMPDLHHFWDNLTMECRRAMTAQKTLSMILVQAKPGERGRAGSDLTEASGDAAKAISRKLRPTDSIYRLSDALFGLLLPETEMLNAKRIAIRLQEQLQSVVADHGFLFEIKVFNYPEQAKSVHELEGFVKSLLPGQTDWDSAAAVTADVV